MKTKAHIIYKTADGQRVAGCTTVVGLLSKPQLVNWANRLGLEGIDVTKYTDDLANVGTLAHELVLAHFTGNKVNTDDYTKNEIDRAENATISFLEWSKDKKITPIINEQPFVSEKLKFGGTIDLYAEVNGEKQLIDFKTGSGIYDDYFYQLGGYALLLEEVGYKIDKAVIVRIGRDETEGFETKSVADLSVHKDIFKNLLNVYQLKKKINRR